MDIAERQIQIVDLVKTHERVRALELSEQFDVSVETIRKDLQALEERGDLVRIHGGAKAPSMSQESAYRRRRSINQEAKQAIAVRAAATIKDDSTVYLDYGTTNLALATQLVDDNRRLTVLTNAIPIAQVLSKGERIETIVLGGILRRNERSLFGPIAERALDGLFMDMGFFGCAGIHIQAGITNPHAFEAATSRKAMTHCGIVTLLADSAKFGSIAANKVADLGDIDNFITETAPEASFRDALEGAKTTLIIAKGQK